MAGGVSDFFSIGPSSDLRARSKHRKSGLEKMQYFISRLRAELIIIDPYFYTTIDQTIEEYVDEFSNVLGMFFSIKRVHIIYKQGRRTCNQELRSEIKKLEVTYDCKITDCHTNLIHDRVWIGDRVTARLLGTSFNGIGHSKISFMLPLPGPDLHDLRFFLQENNLLPDDMQLIKYMRKK